MKESLLILEQAANKKLPDYIDANSNIDLSRFSSLVEQGYIYAIDASDSEGVTYMETEITLAGREYLEFHNNSIGNNVVEDTNSWKIIEDTFNISKQSFGKKINFVTDPKIRKIIFRDTEQAFLLENEGYYKPAIILAGGIIEELLRNYLIVNNIKPNNNTLDEYIRICIEKKIMIKAIGNMAHYIRLMRNLVHIEREANDNTKIDKALAKSIVSSIITLTNSFSN